MSRGFFKESSAPFRSAIAGTTGRPASSNTGFHRSSQKAGTDSARPVLTKFNDGRNRDRIDCERINEAGIRAHNWRSEFGAESVRPIPKFVTYLRLRD